DPKRVGLVDVVAVTPRLNMEFVKRAFNHAGDKSFPDARLAAGGEQMGAGIPGVKAADHRYQLRIGSPDAEYSAGSSVSRNKVRARGFIEAIVAALVEQVEILVRQ